MPRSGHPVESFQLGTILQFLLFGSMGQFGVWQDIHLAQKFQSSKFEDLMFKKFIGISLFVGAFNVFAQVTEEPVRHKPLIQNVTKAPVTEYALKHSFCVYDDKIFTEGAVKMVDKVMLICAVRDTISVSFEKEPKELVWEAATSARGRRLAEMMGLVSLKKQIK